MKLAFVLSDNNSLVRDAIMNIAKATQCQSNLVKFNKASRRIVAAGSHNGDSFRLGSPPGYYFHNSAILGTPSRSGKWPPIAIVVMADLFISFFDANSFSYVYCERI